MPSLWILGGFVKCFLGDFLRLLGFFAFVSGLGVRVSGFAVLGAGIVDNGLFMGSVVKDCGRNDVYHAEKIAPAPARDVVTR